jgi:hypothetical protein
VEEPEAFERMEIRLDAAPIREELLDPLFRPARTARGDGRHGFATRPKLREIDFAADATGPVPAVPQRRLEGSDRGGIAKA